MGQSPIIKFQRNFRAVRPHGAKPHSSRQGKPRACCTNNDTTIGNTIGITSYTNVATIGIYIDITYDTTIDIINCTTIYITKGTTIGMTKDTIDTTIRTIVTTVGLTNGTTTLFYWSY
jgi:hypothetical protein